ncbi:MAG: hypothetical protein JHC34_04985 [Acidobacteria bacterium]|jgi:DUF4097 and DUF4098 domain-containing protein YvlB|nr:hypothetical protein [Acidobacteriota bacterium]
MKRLTGIAALAGMFLALAAFQSPAQAAQATETIQKSFPLAQGGSFSIDNVNGAITVQVWDKNELQVTAVKTVKASSESQAKEELAKLKVIFDASEKSVKITTDYPKESFWSFGWLGGGTSRNVTFTVLAPKGAKMDLQSVNGSVDVGAPGSDVTAETVNGAVTIHGAAILSATSVNGKIVFEADNLRSIETTNGSIEGAVRSEKPSPGSAETVNGSATLRFSPKAAFHLEVENVNGSITSDFGGLEGTAHSKEGDVNGGGATIKIETVNGSVTVLAAK